jgi:hypothetical protein
MLACCDLATLHGLRDRVIITLGANPNLMSRHCEPLHRSAGRFPALRTEPRATDGRFSASGADPRSQSGVTVISAVSPGAARLAVPSTVT